MTDLLANQHCKLPNLSSNKIAIISKLLNTGDMSYFPMVVLAHRNIIDLPRARVHLTNKHLLFNLIMVVLEECRNHRTIIALETLVGSAQMS